MSTQSPNDSPDHDSPSEPFLETNVETPAAAAPAPNRNRQLAQTLMAMLEPFLAEAHYELVDLVVAGVGSIDATVQVLVDHSSDHPLGGRIDLDGVSAVTRLVNETIDAADPIDEAYTLEVSSPGLERPLRVPAHFRRFLGSQVAVRLVPGVAGERRIEGRLMKADEQPDGSITVDGHTIAYSDIERARTIFVWGPQPKRGPGAPGISKTAAKKAAKAAALATAAAGTGSGDEEALSSQTDASEDEDEDEDEDEVDSDEDDFDDEDGFDDEDESDDDYDGEDEGDDDDD